MSSSQSSASDALYGSLLALRASEASRLGVMPYQVLSDAIIRELLKHKPHSLDSLKSMPSLSFLASENIGGAVVKLFAASAPQAAPSAPIPDLPNEDTPKKSTVPSFTRKRGRGATLAVEQDDEPVRTAPEPKPEPAPLDAPSFGAMDLQLYEGYQRDMKSVEILREERNEDVASVQKKLLNIFSSGFPVQLSRLGLIPDIVLYNAIPTVLTLRQGYKGDLKLEMEDLTSGALSASIRMLYPHVSEMAIHLALCEWYHALHPELQLNSARFVAPRTRAKRKEPTEAPTAEFSAPKPSPSIPIPSRNAFISKTAPVTQGVRKSPRLTSQAKMLVSGFNRDHRDAISIPSNDVEEDQDPSPDYSAPTARPTDLWRSQGPRPKKIAKRTTSMENLGFVTFQNNMMKERVALTDDDFSATEEAYFADVYSPAKPAAPTPRPVAKVTAAPKVSIILFGDDILEKSDAEIQEIDNKISKQTSNLGPQAPVAASTSNVSDKSSVSAQSSSSSSAVSAHYEGLSALELFDRFNHIRLAAASNTS